MSNIFKSKFKPENLTAGDPFEIEAGGDRLNYIERTLERLKNDRLKQADIEGQKLIDDARQEAATVREAAEAKASEIIAEGEARRDEVLEQGYNDGEAKGFEKGYADGKAEISQQCIEMMENAKTILNAAYQAQDKMLRRFKFTITSLVFYVTKLILRQELDSGPKKIDGIVSRSIEHLGLQGQLKVVAHQSVVKSLLDFSPETKAALCNLPYIQFEADASLDPHDIYVLSEDSQYTVSPISQAAQYLEAITASLETEVNDTDFRETLEALTSNAAIEATEPEPTTEQTPEEPLQTPTLSALNEPTNMQPPNPEGEPQ